jgi:hypothetical protein
MSDQPNKSAYTPEELRESLNTFDPPALVDSATEGQGGHPDASGKPELPGEQRAEQESLEDQAREAARPVREDKLTHIRPGQSTPNKGGGR